VGRLTPPTHPDLLVGAASGDDAAVWRLDDDRALIATADFITPVVDDARTWGQVAAANAVSDVYAMGGRPLLALNLVGWNTDALSMDLLGEVLAGGQDIAEAAGFVIAGGHTIDDPEPKYGMAVVGEVHPDKLLTNSGLRAGDHLVLTKPLGIGVITTALKRGLASEDVVEAALESMTRLNDVGAAVALAAGATGATDVTGFGLLGHLGRMARESAVDVTLSVADVPILSGAVALAEQGAIPGGTERNTAWIRAQLDVGDTTELMVTLLADAQTSGGLIFGAASAVEASDAVAELRASGHDAAVVGSVSTGSGTIRLR
jgi:selenide,water dikinase